MKPFRCPAAALCLPLLLLTLLCAAEPELHAEKTGHKEKENRRASTHVIERLEEQWRQAILRSDGTALDKLLADDFLGISANGTLSDKHQYVERIESHENEFKLIDLIDLKVRVQPGLAVATSEARVSGSLEKRPIGGIFRYTKVYTRDNAGQWRVLSFEATRVSGSEAETGDMMRGQPLRNSPHQEKAPAPHH